jgi:hypothetical protein
MAGLKRALLCKGTLPISCFLSLPVHPALLLCLTVDTTPNYVDTQPFHATKAVWSYKAIYRADDAQVGQWSQPVTVAVGG